jgi:hypothetical protein
MDAHTVFEPRVGDIEGGQTGGQRRLRAGRHRDAPRICHHVSTEGRQLLQAKAFVCRGSEQLFDDDSSRRAATTGSGLGVVRRQIVVDEYSGHGDPVGLEPFGSDTEVDSVSGVVLHDVEDSGFACSSQTRLVDLPVVRRREHATGNSGVEHPLANKTHVHGFVPGSTPADEPDPPARMPVTRQDEERIRMQFDEAVVCLREPAE